MKLYYKEDKSQSVEPEKQKIPLLQLRRVIKKINSLNVQDWLKVAKAVTDNPNYNNIEAQTQINLAALLVELGFDDFQKLHADSARRIFRSKNGQLARAISDSEWDWFSKLIDKLS